MLTLFTIAIIALLIVMMSTASRRGQQMDQLNGHLRDLTDEVKVIRQILPKTSPDSSGKAAAPPPETIRRKTETEPQLRPQPAPAPNPAPAILPQPVRPAPPVIEERVSPPPPVAPAAEDTAPPAVSEAAPPQPRPVPPPAPPAAAPPLAAFSDALPADAPSAQPRRSAIPDEIPERDSFLTRWLRSNPDLEKFIGENLINKIGIAILVLGIAFFVKYAIDQNWIGEAGRVAIGLGCGALLAGIAHRLRQGYRAFSSVLAGGGIVVFYFTIAFAYQQYALIGQAAAFCIMVLITLLAVALAILYDRIELAVIAMVGGFLTPFLLSRGSGAYPVLFTYLLILNAGMLLLAFFKRWPLLNVLSLLFTGLIYGGFLLSGRPYTPGTVLLFGGAFYLLFLGMNMAYPLRRKAPFHAFDFSILISITALYYAAGMCILHPVGAGRYEGLFTLLMGLVNLGLAAWLFLRKKADRVLLYLVIGLTLTFLTLAIPVQLHGHTITLFWSAEFVLLHWLWQRSRIRLFQRSALLVAGLSLISLFMDWQIAASAPGHIRTLLFTNVQGLITNLVSVAAFACWAVLLRRERGEGADTAFGGQAAARTATGISLSLLYLTVFFTVNLIFQHEVLYAVAAAYHRLATGLFVLGLFSLGRRHDHPKRMQLRLTLMILFFLYYLMNGVEIALLRNAVLAGEASPLHLAAHWTGLALLLYGCYRTLRMVQRERSAFQSRYTLLTLGSTVLLVLLFSLEGASLYLLLFAGNVQRVGTVLDQYNKAPLTILWGLCSFALMWAGMRHRNKPARIISLSLFSLALLKLFLLDIRGLSEGGRIAAFILLGVLLLTISFMYQKLKRLLLDDQTGHRHEDD